MNHGWNKVDISKLYINHHQIIFFTPWLQIKCNITYNVYLNHDPIHDPNLILMINSLLASIIRPITVQYCSVNPLTENKSLYH